MPTFSRYAMTSMALTGLWFGVCAEPQAADKTGVIHISDTLTPLPEPNPLPASFAESTSNVGSSNGTWNVSAAQCGNSAQYGEHGPEIRPLLRDPVVYQRYWPRYWYGDPRAGIPANAARAPMVFTPTDTTQLGYYYQRVPQWQPAPWMLPRPPGPWVHHFRRCRHHSSNQCWGNCRGGSVIDSSPTPANPQAPVPPAPDKTAAR